MIGVGEAGMTTQEKQKEPDDEPLLRRIVDGVFGYDFFLSYSHADGKD
jgi:hypothetical protein